MQPTTWLLLLITTSALVAGSTDGPEYLWGTDYDVTEDLPTENIATCTNSPEDLLHVNCEDKSRAGTVNILYPRETKTREVRLLDGIWRFFKSSYDKPNEGLEGKWYENGLDKLGLKTIPMPVPSSYNDITTDKDLRDHIGAVWYERTFFVPETWKENRIVWLRFNGVGNDLRVWINGKEVKENFNTDNSYEKIGNYPSIRDITKEIVFSDVNRITVFSSNVLNKNTVPRGNYATIHGKKVPDHTFNYFFYDGIHRSVLLYTTPLSYISDIQVRESKLLKNGNAQIYYDVVVTNIKDLKLETILYDKTGNNVTKSTSSGPTLEVANPKLWWPYLMDKEPGYLYSLECTLYDAKKNVIDVYRMPYGIRSLRWDEKGMFINNKPIYFHGVNKHEDSDIRGRGHDLALLTRDFNLLKWLGANVYRTTHYPHSDEAMQLADELGIMIIDECASINLDTFEDDYLKFHKNAMSMLTRRDRNHPSVIAYSVHHGTETHVNTSEKYFKDLVTASKWYDKTRPFTGSFSHLNEDYMAKSLDIVGWFDHQGWSVDFGYTDWIKETVVESLKKVYEKNKKPIIMIGYGAQAVEGYHGNPSYAWSEEYQSEVLTQHFKAFETLRKESWFSGELVDSFADFKAKPQKEFVNYDRMGIFTRQRESKAAAGVLRQHYHALAKDMYNYALPKDLFLHVVD